MAQLVPDPAESSLVGTTRLSYLFIKGGSASLASSIVTTTMSLASQTMLFLRPKPALEFPMVALRDINGKGVLPASTGPVARYLGPHLDIMGSIRPELERRRAAAFRT